MIQGPYLTKSMVDFLIYISLLDIYLGLHLLYRSKIEGGNLQFIILLPISSREERSIHEVHD